MNNLRELLCGDDYNILSGDIDIEIKGITSDSRKVSEGFLFVAIKGETSDGHLFIKTAVSNGAIAIIALESEYKPIEDVTYIIVSNTRKTLTYLMRAWYDFPDKKMGFIGVTGTKGKTTTTHLIDAILTENNFNTGLLGTVCHKVCGQIRESLNTTPLPEDLYPILKDALEYKTDYITMEVSSHSLALHRVDGIDFDIAVFTNLAPEHFDFHKNMENYSQTKKILFENIAVSSKKFPVAIVNIHDEYADLMFESSGNAKKIGFGIFNENTQDRLEYFFNKEIELIFAKNINSGLQGSSFCVSVKNVYYTKEIGEFFIPLTGEFNVLNSLASIATAISLNIDINVIKKALKNLSVVPGRFEECSRFRDALFIVDYAHTADSLKNVLSTAKNIAENRLITVFGCGGDRDKTKRPKMAYEACKYSDIVIVTSDNPRTEDPDKIIEDVLTGIPPDFEINRNLFVERDRKKAIKKAVNLSCKGDIIMVAGKGHEDYQIIGREKIHFDDRKIIIEWVKYYEQNS